MSAQAIRDGEEGMLAAEYVLHLLTPEERREAEDRLAIDGGFRAEVAGWTEDFAALANGLAPVEPPASVRAALAGMIGGDTRAEAPAQARRGGATGGVAKTLFGALLGGVLALFVIVMVLPDMQGPTAPGPVYQARIAGLESELVFEARFDPARQLLSLDRQSGGAPEGRVLELWLIEGENAPVSLGVLPDAERTEFTLPQSLAEGMPGGTLALSDEPPGGSPTGAPTGTVLAAGQLSDA